MRNLLRLLRAERHLGRFLLAHAQSSLGNGAAYVALLVFAYKQFDSGLAVAAVLLGDFLPSMLAGPLLGAAADRWGPRNCAIAANVLRAVAFAALPFVTGLAPVLALVLVAGLGSCLFMPAAHTLLPQLVD